MGLLSSGDSQNASLDASGDKLANQAGNTEGTNVTGPTVSGSGKYVQNRVTVDAANQSGNQGIITEGGQHTITLSDQGAIDAGREIALAGIEFTEGMASSTNQLLESNFTQAIGILEDSNSSILENSKTAINAVQEANKSESTKAARLLVIAGAGVVSIVGIVMVARALSEKK